MCIRDRSNRALSRLSVVTSLKMEITCAGCRPPGANCGTEVTVSQSSCFFSRWYKPSNMLSTTCPVLRARCEGRASPASSWPCWSTMRHWLRSSSLARSLPSPTPSTVSYTHLDVYKRQVAAGTGAALQTPRLRLPAPGPGCGRWRKQPGKPLRPSGCRGRLR